MTWLASYQKVPPGQFYVYHGDKLFGPSPEIRSVAKRLRAFRKANSLPRDTETDALEDIIRFTCERLRGAAPWCYETDQAVSTLIALAQASPCSTCGATLT